MTNKQAENCSTNCLVTKELLPSINLKLIEKKKRKERGEKTHKDKYQEIRACFQLRRLQKNFSLFVSYATTDKYYSIKLILKHK